MDSVVLQQLVVALAVLASAVFVLQRQWPGAVRRARVAVAVRLLREHRSKPLRALGRVIAPPPSMDGNCGGCSSGCSTGQ